MWRPASEEPWAMCSETVVEGTMAVIHTVGSDLSSTYGQLSWRETWLKWFQSVVQGQMLWCGSAVTTNSRVNHRNTTISPATCSQGVDIDWRKKSAGRLQICEVYPCEHRIVLAMRSLNHTADMQRQYMWFTMWCCVAEDNKQLKCRDLEEILTCQPPSRRMSFVLSVGHTHSLAETEAHTSVCSNASLAHVLKFRLWLRTTRLHDATTMRCRNKRELSVVTARNSSQSLTPHITDCNVLWLTCHRNGMLQTDSWTQTKQTGTRNRETFTLKEWIWVCLLRKKCANPASCVHICRKRHLDLPFGFEDVFFSCIMCDSCDFGGWWCTMQSIADMLGAMISWSFWSDLVYILVCVWET